jgi:hypothetical protein
VARYLGVSLWRGIESGCGQRRSGIIPGLCWAEENTRIGSSLWGETGLRGVHHRREASSGLNVKLRLYKMRTGSPGFEKQEETCRISWGGWAKQA